MENSARDENIRPPDLPLEKPICRSGSNWTWNNRVVPNRKRSMLRLLYILLPCLLFNLYAGYIVRNAVLNEAQAGIKIGGRNIYKLRCAGDTALLAEN